jgi:hypothetical protein
VAEESHFLFGKCAVENFGKYFILPLEERVAAIKVEEQKVEAEQRREDFLASPEGRKAIADQREAAAADPLHNLHSVDARSLTERVRFTENPLKNYQEAGRMLSRVRKHCRAFIQTKGWLHQKTLDESGDLSHRIMRRGLSKINQYYQQPVPATPEVFTAAIDRAILQTEPSMPLLFVVVPEPMEVANA